MRQRIVVATLLATILMSSACASDLRVTTIQLGRSINTDNTVANHTTTFGPNDTVYVSVQMAGSGSGTVGVRWTYMGRVVGEPRKQVSFRGGGATEFHLQNAGGFPPGEYTVEVLMNDQPAGTRNFRVETDR
ncbi:MAG TPA: hypothetical protein VGD94_17280 [Vicinamibacterales bacterium]